MTALAGLLSSLKQFDPGLAGSNDLLIVLTVDVYETVPTQTLL